MIVGGIQTFLPISPTKASASVAHEEVMQRASKKEAMGPNDFKTICVCDAGETKERQATKTAEQKEKEKTLISAPTEGEQHSTKLLEIFSQEAEQEMIAELESTTEDEEYNMDFVDLCE
jgi:hypothetical protein